VVVTRSEQRLRHIFEELQQETKKMGLEVNEGKTKYMIISTSEIRTKPRNLKIGQE